MTQFPYVLQRLVSGKIDWEDLGIATSYTEACKLYDEAKIKLTDDLSRFRIIKMLILMEDE